MRADRQNIAKPVGAVFNFRLRIHLKISRLLSFRRHQQKQWPPQRRTEKAERCEGEQIETAEVDFWFPGLQGRSHTPLSRHTVVYKALAMYEKLLTP